MFQDGKKAALAALLFYSTALLANPTDGPILKANSREPEIRVRIGQKLPSVEISGLDLERNLHLSQDLKTFAGRKSIRFNCKRFGELNRSVISLRQPLLLASLTSKTGLLTINNERFRGKLKVISTSNADSCDVIHVTSMEDYISTLLAKEMNASWPIEALKAQAIAARTYAYHKIQSQQVSRSRGFEAFYDLESSEYHQVSGSFFDANERTLQATRSTRGMIMETLGGEITEIFFHAKCGGHTLEPQHVWANKVSGYKAVKDPYCHGRGNMGEWKTVLERSRVDEFLNWARVRGHLAYPTLITGQTKLQFTPDEREKPVMRIFIEGQAFELNKSLFRRYFGRTTFESNFFDLSIHGTNLLVNGKGKGHGVGMCQIGALGMADRGFDYTKILGHYFPGHQLKKIY